MPATLSNIEVWLCDPFGVRFANLGYYNKLEYARVLNDIGVLKIDLPGGDLIPYIQRDCQIEVWRTVTDEANQHSRAFLDMETIWFVRKMRVESPSGRLMTILTAYSVNDLVRRRVVAYPRGSTQAEKNIAADDMLKTFAAENFGASAGTSLGRNISSLVKIQGNTAQAPVVTKKAAWKELMPTMQEICQSAEVQGSPLFFDIVATGDASGGPILEFRTYVGARGVDRSSTGNVPLLFATELGNLTVPSYEIDWADEADYIYGLGRGHETQRQEATSTDTVRVASSPYALTERIHACHNYNNASQMQQETDNALREARPRELFSCQIVSTTTTLFGRDFGFGDLVIASFAGKQFDCRIEAVRITIAPGQETIDIKLKKGLIS